MKDLVLTALAVNGLMMLHHLVYLITFNSVRERS